EGGPIGIAAPGNYYVTVAGYNDLNDVGDFSLSLSENSAVTQLSQTTLPWTINGSITPTDIVLGIGVTINVAADLTSYTTASLRILESSFFNAPLTVGAIINEAVLVDLAGTCSYYMFLTDAGGNNFVSTIISLTQVLPPAPTLSFTQSATIILPGDSFDVTAIFANGIGTITQDFVTSLTSGVPITLTPAGLGQYMWNIEVNNGFASVSASPTVFVAPHDPKLQLKRSNNNTNETVILVDQTGSYNAANGTANASFVTDGIYLLLFADYPWYDTAQINPGAIDLVRQDAVAFLYQADNSTVEYTLTVQKGSNPAEVFGSITVTTS
ncbi:MAG: hypothetical protein WCM93_14285, partial [Bacteroidota bacterium]